MRGIAHALAIGAASFVLLAAGCAGTGGLSGERLLRRGDLVRAIPLLASEEAVRPRDAALKRNLGIALYQDGRAAEAAEKLTAARALEPRDRETIYFLARASELVGERNEAIEAYGTYLELGGPKRAAVRSRLRELSLERARVEIQQSLAREDSLTTVSLAENSIVVPQFANVSGREALDPLSRGLSLVLTTDLSRVRQLRLLERERMDVLRTEMMLSSASDPAMNAVVSPGSAPRLGRLIGARRFVQGSFINLSETGIQLDAAVLDASNGSLASTSQPVSGPLADVLVLEKALCLRVLEALGISPSPEERAAINLLPTRDYRAFLAFARGIGFEDAGQKEQAIAAYQEAVSIDPSFEVARFRREVLEVTARDLEAGDEAEAREAYGRELDPRERLMRTGKWTWLVPDTDTAGSDAGDDTRVSGPNSIGDRDGAASVAVGGAIPRR